MQPLQDPLGCYMHGDLGWEITLSLYTLVRTSLSTNASAPEDERQGGGSHAGPQETRHAFMVGHTGQYVLTRDKRHEREADDCRSHDQWMTRWCGGLLGVGGCVLCQLCPNKMCVCLCVSHILAHAWNCSTRRQTLVIKKIRYH